MPRKPIEFVNHPLAFPGGEYRAFCHHIVDGDTFDVLVDLGFFEYAYRPIRLLGYDAYELHRAEEHERAVRDADALRGLIDSAYLRIVTQKDAMTFDRFLADAYVVSANAPEVAVVPWLKANGFGKS